MSQNKNVWSFKIIILGQVNAGKSSLRRSYLGNDFKINHIDTIGADFSFKHINLDGDEINASIWDLSEIPNEDQKIHHHYFKGAAGAVIVYDVSDSDSLYDVEKWLNMFIDSTSATQRPILIIGNKNDLNEDHTPHVPLDVQEELITKIKQKHSKNLVYHTRVSARTGVGVEEGFAQLFRSIKDIWTKNAASLEKLEILKYEKYIPAAYIITFDDSLGPQILLRSPFRDNYSNKEYVSAIKLATTLDFDEVVAETEMKGSFSWSNPRSLLYYITFTVDHEQIRGKKILFIIGAAPIREIKYLISEKQMKIDNILNDFMNDFISLLIIRNIDLLESGSVKITKEIDRIEIEKLLLRLRVDIFDEIKVKIL